MNTKKTLIGIGILVIIIGVIFIANQIQRTSNIQKLIHEVRQEKLIVRELIHEVRQERYFIEGYSAGMKYLDMDSAYKAVYNEDQKQ